MRSRSATAQIEFQEGDRRLAGAIVQERPEPGCGVEWSGLARGGDEADAGPFAT